MSTLPSLGRIAGMDHAALSDAYSRVFDVPVPRRMSRVLLARILAYEVQVKAKGGIPAALRRRLTNICLLYTSPSPRDRQKSRMPSSA